MQGENDSVVCTSSNGLCFGFATSLHFSQHILLFHSRSVSALWIRFDSRIMALIWTGNNIIMSPVQHCWIQHWSRHWFNGQNNPFLPQSCTSATHTRFQREAHKPFWLPFYFILHICLILGRFRIFLIGGMILCTVQEMLRMEFTEFMSLFSGKVFLTSVTVKFLSCVDALML